MIFLRLYSIKCMLIEGGVYLYSDEKIRKIIRIAIDNVQKEGTTDVELFNRHFEIELLKNAEVQKQLVDKIHNEIKQKKFEMMGFSKNGMVLVPKKNLYDFRKCALIDVADEVRYLSLVLLIAGDIESARINKSKNVIFSYRYQAKDGYLFDQQYHYTSFRTAVVEKSKKKNNKVVVECDIANFYDRLNIHRLESILYSISTIQEDVVKLINDLLLYWANRDSYGLPVGSNASRILAEAALIEVDNYLKSQKVDFCRFVDDYRIFAKDAATAHKHLSLLVEALNREGLFINTGKTKIKDISLYENKYETNEDETNKDEVSKDETNKVPKVVNWENNDLPKIIRGYSGIVPTKFRRLTEKEILKLKEINELELLDKLKESLLLEPSELVKLIKIVIAKENYEIIKDIPELLRKFPQFMPYFIDVLIKYDVNLSEEIVNHIKLSFTVWFEEKNIPEYILVYLVRAYSQGKMEDKDVLLEYFRNSKRAAGDYIGRALLESFNGKLTRGDLLEIRSYYTRADMWEKRQILKLINKGLSPGEKRPFFKDVQMHNNDFFIPFIISTKNDYFNLI